MRKQLTSGILAGVALFLTAGLSQASANYTFDISGNGSHSDNTIKFSSENNVSVTQKNNTRISNDVNVDLSTGGNRASGNTGGDTSIETGDAHADVSISNTAGMNYAQLGGCCNDQDVDVEIKGNGYKSDNTVDLSFENNTSVHQSNYTSIKNDVDVNATTGDNTVGGKTWGDTSIETGDAHADINIQNTAGVNYAQLNSGNTGDIDVSIKGNGYKSDNTVDLNVENNTSVSQHNSTNIDNDVDVNLETGDNNVSSQGKNYHDYDKWKEYDHKKHEYDKDKDHKYDFNKKSYSDKKDDHKKYFDYDKDKKYKYYDEKEDHEKKYFKKAKYDYDYDRKDHKKHSYDHGKKLGHLKRDYAHDNRDNDHRKHAFDYKKFHADFAKYKKNYDHGKYTNRNDHSDYNDCRDGRQMTYKPWKKSNKGEWDKDKYSKHHGNWGGDSKIQTGDIQANVSIKNVGSSNFLYL